MGTLIRCLPLPYRAPCIKHVVVKMEKTCMLLVTSSVFTLAGVYYHRQGDEIVLDPNEANKLEAREEP